jgi:hypothetical protein
MPPHPKHDAFVGPFHGVELTGFRWAAQHLRYVPRTPRSAPLLAAWCAAEPGPYQAPAFVTVPALRSGMKNAAPRPGHDSGYALNQPLASPVYV